MEIMWWKVLLSVENFLLNLSFLIFELLLINLLLLGRGLSWLDFPTLFNTFIQHIWLIFGLLPSILLFIFLFMLYGLISAAKMRFALLIFFILLLDDLFLLKLEFLLLGTWVVVHLGHIEDLEHGEEIEMGHIQTLKDDLGDDKIDVLLLKFNFLEKLEKMAFWDGSLTIFFGSECWQYLLVVGGDQLSNLDKHLLFFLLLLNIIFGHQFTVGLDDGSLFELLLTVNVDGKFAGGICQFGN